MASITNYGNGKYRIIVCNGRKADGSLNRATKTISARSEAEAKRKASEFEYEFRHNNIVTEKQVLFRELVELWKTRENKKYKISTLSRYDGMLKKYILPVFGGYNVKNITRKEISDYIYSLEEKGLCAKTVRNHFVFLSSLFTYAIDYGILDINVCSTIKHKPKYEVAEAKYYEPEDVEKMLKCLEIDIYEDHINKDMYSMYSKEILKKVNIYIGKMYQMYIYLALTSSCRRSEMIGLEWKDIDYKNKTMYIQRVTMYTPKKGIYTEYSLKTGDKEKVIELPDKIIDMLKEYKKEQDEIRKVAGEKWVNSDRVFISLLDGKVGTAGGAMLPDTISQWFSKFIKRYNLPKLSIHGIRHTGISYLINENVDIKTVAERAGHSRVSTTTDIYAHVFKKNKRKCADIMNNLI